MESGSIQEERPLIENDDEESLNNDTPIQPLPEKISVFKLIALTISFLGVQFGWAVQIAYTTPIFLELGVGKFWVSFVWLAGPISGLLIQPTVGVISDKSSLKWGRRRPFIFGGAIFILIGMFLISNASFLGSLMGDTQNHNPIAVTLAVIGFWILDLANNTVQGPCRALLVDIAPPSQQNLGGSLFSFMLGLGNLAGYSAGSFKLLNIFPFFKTDIRALFTIGMIVMFSSILITVIFVKEKPFIKDPTQKIENPFIQIFKGIWTMPKPMKRVCLVQFTGWLAWFTFLLYISGWVGENVYHGIPDAPPDSKYLELFEDGVRTASLGLTINAGVTMVVSLFLPKLAIRPGLRVTYFIAQVILGIALLSTVAVKTKVGAILVIAACGIPWAVVMVFPFTLVALNVDESQSGLYMGVLNIFVVLPQIVVSLGIGFILTQFNGNLAIPLACGGIFALISSVTVFTLIVDTEKLLKGISTSQRGGH